MVSGERPDYTSLQENRKPPPMPNVLDMFLSHKSIIDDTKLVLQNQLMDNESRPGLCMLKPMKAFLYKIFECRKGRITNGHEEIRPWAYWYAHRVS